MAKVITCTPAPAPRRAFTTNAQAAKEISTALFARLRKPFGTTPATRCIPAKACTSDASEIGFTYVAKVVPVAEYVSACMEAESLLNQNIIQLVFFQGQEAIANEWLATRTHQGPNSTIPAILSRHLFKSEALIAKGV